jgi:hypothetical protein
MQVMCLFGLGANHAWVVGSSIVHWASRSAAGRAGSPHLGLQYRRLTLHWYGKRGMKWGELMSIIDNNLHSNPAPNILVIQLGSNDLGILKGKELIELIRLDVLRIRTLLPNVILVWSEILPRRYWHVANNHVAVENSRKWVNTAAKKPFS